MPPPWFYTITDDNGKVENAVNESALAKVVFALALDNFAN